MLLVGAFDPQKPLPNVMFLVKR